MSVGKPVWLVTCYERECISAWAATATAKLHVVHLGDKSVEHRTTIKDPPQPGEQLQLP